MASESLFSSAAGPSDPGRRRPRRQKSASEAGEGPVPSEDDTCRICRGESTPDDRLFFPCKCSGSIRYVHQDCLMEWLSHSRKKYCELCKTHFRFTKLYDPHMPKQLPWKVFIREALVHSASHISLWCRAALVVGVWLLCLPWIMRYIWRTLFWLGDGEWASHMAIGVQGTVQAARSSGSTFLTNSEAGSVPQQAILTSYLPTRVKWLTHYVGWVYWSFRYLRLKLKSSLVLMVLKKLVPSSHLRRRIDLHLSHLNKTLVKRSRSLNAHPTLLSEVGFLKDLTSWPILNKLIVDIMEGQTIVLLVVVAFTLVFLIREWVVQLQPMIVQLRDAENEALQPPVPEAVDADDNHDEVAAAADADLNGSDRSADTDIDADLEGDHDQEDTDAIFNSSILYWFDANDPEELKRAIGQLDIDLYWLQQIEELAKPIPQETRDFLRLRGIQALKTHPSLSADGQVGHLVTYVNTVLDRSRFRKSAGAETPLPPSDGFLLPPNLYRVDKVLRQDNAMDSALKLQFEEKVKTIKALQYELKFILSGGLATGPEKEEVDIKRSGDTEDSDMRIWEANSAPEAEVDDSGNSTSFRRINKGKAKMEITDDGKFTPTSSDPHSSNPSSSHPLKEPEPDASMSSSPYSFEAALDPANVNADYKYIFKEEQNVENEKDEGTEARREDTGIMSAKSSDSDVVANTAETNGLDSLNMRQGTVIVQRRVKKMHNRTWSEWILDCIWGDIVHSEITETSIQICQGPEASSHDALPDRMEFRHAHETDSSDTSDNGNEEVVGIPRELEIAPHPQEIPEEGEDLEGIFELIGLHGPLSGLFQNAVVSAILISSAIIGAIWSPYLWGKFFLIILGNPFTLLFKLPVRLLLVTSDVIADLSLVVCGHVLLWTSWLLRRCLLSLNPSELVKNSLARLEAFTSTPETVALSASNRLVRALNTVSTSSNGDMLFISVNAHIALRRIQQSVLNNINLGMSLIVKACHHVQTITFGNALRNVVPVFLRGLYLLLQLGRTAKATLLAMLQSASSTSLLSIKFPNESTAFTNDLEKPYWTATDRLLVILAGYSFFALLGTVYLKFGKPFTSSTRGQRLERGLSDLLQQAGGVLKVILIISIEMIMFPLYCGLLLDIALLPLFKDASLLSRITFALDSPWKSGFIHWFIGTCYMYHFALFVSMCRKIMRKGVLYFIRDPDDPSFHPIRDVLERTVTTQLRKIAFSAIVYGAMITVSLGGVVWSLPLCYSSILPLRWTPEPLFGFAIDIMLYCFLTPVLLKYVKISETFNRMYKWWFRKCARTLRLSHFLFGERLVDEEGYCTERSPDKVLHDEARMDDSNHDKGEKNAPAEAQNQKSNFQFDGRFVAVPATDQVRIRKGTRVFVEVSGPDDRLEDGLRNNINGIAPKKTTVVYIPPRFASRITLFIVSIWLFAAAIGLTVTIIPLVLGRYVFSTFTARQTPMNDVYAFSLGMYLLGGVLFAGYKITSVMQRASREQKLRAASVQDSWEAFRSLSGRAASFVYVYGVLSLISLFLLSLLIEFYILMPLHTLYKPGETHTVHIIQDWTLGFLYGRIITHFLFRQAGSRPSRILRAITGLDYKHPNAWLATRYFALPALLAFGVALLLPYAMSSLTMALFLPARHDNDRFRVVVHRLAYPALLLMIFAVWLFFALEKAVGRWRMRIRDEVYLIGERLHNYGEKKAGPGPPSKIKLK